MSDSRSNDFFSSILNAGLFVLGCLFLYWSMQYWVDKNFDSSRYDLYKIQTSGGADSWSFWKLDRRTGGVEFCNLQAKVDGGQADFSCQRARTEPAAAPLKSTVPAE